MGCSTIEEDSYSESAASDPKIQAIYTSQSALVSSASLIPIAQAHILLDTYSKPTLVIALFDIGVVATIIHPKILLEEFWLPHYQMFHTANGEKFPITEKKKRKKSKPILIRIFPTFTIKHQVLGSPLTGRDLLIGFDILHQIPSFRWSSKGLSHKQHLLTWTQFPHLFVVDPYDSLRFQIIKDCCANSHSEFLQKKFKSFMDEPGLFHTPFL